MQAVNERNIANLLLVDDSILEYKLAVAIMEMEKIHVNLVAYQDGLEAIQYINQLAESVGTDAPDLILLDINMPVIDGRKFLALMRDQSKLESIPVVMYSGSCATKDVDETVELGAVTYVEKPLSFEKLEKITSIISKLHFEEKGDDRYLCCSR